MMLFMRHVPAQTAEISPPRPLRCAVYARVSVDDRQDSDMPSVEVQGQACRAYIEAHRHEHWQAIEPVYEDSGYSGGDLNRPALRQLLDDMQSDKIDVVLVHRLDRLSRSVQDLCALLPLFTIPGIRLVSMSQPLDTATPEGRLNLHLLTSFAQFERELIGERTREKLTATRANGLWQGNGAPLGTVLTISSASQWSMLKRAWCGTFFGAFWISAPWANWSTSCKSAATRPSIG